MIDDWPGQALTIEKDIPEAHSSQLDFAWLSKGLLQDEVVAAQDQISKTYKGNAVTISFFYLKM